jgi:putative ABC transport system permease protein
MLWVSYLIRSLWRNPLRLILTVAGIALPMGIYVLSTSAVGELEKTLGNAAKQLRLVVAHRSSLVNPLPSAYRGKIESLDPTRTRIVSVCGVRYIGGQVEPDLRPLPTLAVDADTFAATFPEYQLTQEEQDAWIRDRRAMVIGPGSGKMFGWKAGDRLTLQPSVAPYLPMQLVVVSRPKQSRDPITNWCRRDYFDAELEAFGDRGSFVNFFFVKCATEADLSHFRESIDAMFAASPDPTRTLDDRAFMSEFITQQLDLPRNLSILGAISVFVAMLAAANMLKMNFRERISEVTTLKSLGFGGTTLRGLALAESMLICTAGGLAGALIPYVALTHTPLRDVPVPLILNITIEPVICLKAVLASVVAAAIAAQWAAAPTIKLTINEGLRRLE